MNAPKDRQKATILMEMERAGLSDDKESALGNALEGDGRENTRYALQKSLDEWQQRHLIPFAIPMGA